MMKKENKVFKAFRYLCLSFVVVTGLVAIIGTGGGGGGGGGGGTTLLATGEFTKTIDPTDDVTFSSSYFSATTYHSHNLYPASEINGSGNITSISVEYAAVEAADITCADVTIKMGHTTLGSLGTTFANNVEQGAGSVQTVLTNASLVFPAGPIGDWVEIPLDTPFYYNGVDNLVVDITTNVGCSDTFDTDVTTAFGYTSTVWDSNIAAPIAGSSGTFRADMEFQFEGGDNPLFSNPTTSTPVPFNDDPNAQREQQLYLASDINGSGPITGLGIQVGNLTLEETYTVSVNLGHATVTTLASDYAANYSGSPVTVANAVSFTVPANVPANSYVWIPLPDAVFTYNGTDNLILELDVTAATGDTAYGYHDHGSGDVRLLYGPSDASVIIPINAAIHHSKFRFNGGTMDALPYGSPTTMAHVFKNTNAQSMWSYAATELGTKGQINKIALRLANDSIADSYPNHRIVIGHSDDLTFNITDTFLDQMTNEKTVRAATFNVPTGLKAGDWIEIPLSSSFSYDSTKNLVVYYDVTAATGGNSNPVRVATDASYTDRSAGRDTENSSQNNIPVGTFPGVLQLRLWLN